MNRSLFLLITALLGFLFGILLLLMPAKAAEGFGFVGDPQIDLLFRAMGGMLFSAGLLNWMVRAQGDSPTLAAVLWFNVAVHGLSLVVDLSGVMEGTLDIAKIAVGQVTHVFVLVGSAIYLMRMRAAA